MLAHTRGQREVDYWENIVQLLGKFTELGKIDERRDMSLFQVLDWAVPPEFKSKPLSCHPMFKGFIKASLSHKLKRGRQPTLAGLRVVASTKQET